MTLVANPLASIRFVDEGRSAMVVRAPVRGRNLAVTTITREAEPGVFAALLVYAARPELGLPTDLVDSERARLADVGLLVSSDRISRPVTFACDLDDPESDRVAGPPAEGQHVPAGEQNLVVNPTLRYLGSEGPSREMRGRIALPNPFRPGRAWLVVEPSLAQLPAFYSWVPDRTPLLASLTPGAPLPAPISSRLRARLVEAGVAVAAGSVPSGRSTVEHWRTELNARRYVILKTPTHRLQTEAIRRYYRDLIAEGFLVFGDRDWPLRHMARFDPVAHFFHEQWTGLASAVAGQPLKASFPFFASYHAGADLGAHRDREQCIFSISVQLDHEPEPRGDAPWPIVMQPGGPETAVPVTMGIGDAVMFYGQEVLHYREPLPEGRSSYWFLFYVPQDFAGPLD